VQEKLLRIELLEMCLIMASIYGLNKVMMRSESSSNEDEMAKHPIGDLSNGRRSDVYMSYSIVLMTLMFPHFRQQDASLSV
jgi:hypothetical protein